MKKPFALAALSVLMFGQTLHAQDTPAAATPAASDKDYVMIKVNGDEIKKSEVDAAWKAIFQGHEVKPLDSVDPKLKNNFLRDIASEHVLYKEAQKEGVENTPSVKEAIENAKRQVVIRQLLVDNTKAALTDDKLKAAYDAHLKAAQAGSSLDEMNARHILVKSKEEADAIEKRLKAGEDFAKIAKEKSLDKSSTDGGDLGWFTADKMVPEFSAALLKLKKGEISPPVKTDFGWHIIQLEDVRKAAPPSFADVKDTLEQELGNKAVNDYIRKLMANVTVTQVDAQGKEVVVPPTPSEQKGAASDKDDSAD